LGLSDETKGIPMNEILILGAGYTGMAATVALAARVKRRDDVHITVVNPQTRFTERLRLHQTASGQQLADLQIPDLLGGTGVDFVQGWVTAIDADAQTVRVDDDRELRYDTLVYALGAVADTEAVPGVDEFAYTLNNAQDAALLAEHLDRLNGGTVIVAGGGLTGVESAAEIAEQHPDLQVMLLSRQVPGSMMGDRARARLHAGLERLGVQVRAGVDIVKVMADGVALDDGAVVAAQAVLWTTGVRVSPMAAAAGLDVDERGRIVTDESLRSVSHPNVYAVGDAAAIRQAYGVMHGTCQSGIPTALHAAASIARELTGKRPKEFRFGYVHQPVSLGRHDAVIQFTHADDSPGWFYLAGPLAVAYKETVSSSPWTTFRLLKAIPAAGTATWRRSGRSTQYPSCSSRPQYSSCSSRPQYSSCSSRPQ
jgi:NADH:ubiquinone reductase (H+-translocating)